MWKPVVFHRFSLIVDLHFWSNQTMRFEGKGYQGVRKTFDENFGPTAKYFVMDCSIAQSNKFYSSSEGV